MKIYRTIPTESDKEFIKTNALELTPKQASDRLNLNYGAITRFLRNNKMNMVDFIHDKKRSPRQSTKVKHKPQEGYFNWDVFDGDVTGIGSKYLN